MPTSFFCKHSSMNSSFLLIAAAAGVLGSLGCLHLLYTFRGNKLDPRNPALRTAMENESPVIARQTTMWRAYRGFNATHSLGIIVFALVYGYLALWRAEVLAGSLFLLVLGMGVLLAYLALARRYFFRIPFRGVALACLLYAGGWLIL
jgi:hypothetical protein